MALTVVLAGCSAATTQESPAGNIVVVAGEATDAHPQALAKGTAEWGDGGCMVIRGEGTYLVMFPHGTTLNENDEVTLPDGYRMNAGDDVALGGGYYEADTIRSDVSTIPDACLTDEIFFASGEVSE